MDEDEREGLIDVSGKVVVDFEMDEIIRVRENIYKLEKNLKQAYYNAATRTYLWKEEGF